jgi:hypothetical protein
MFKKLIAEARYVLEGGGSRLSKPRRQAAFRNAIKPPTDYGASLGPNWPSHRKHKDKYDTNIAKHRKFIKASGSDRLSRRKPGSGVKFGYAHDFWERPKLP